jgi:hypothetical protein
MGGSAFEGAPLLMHRLFVVVYDYFLFLCARAIKFDLDWHMIRPFFLLFFHSGPELCASGSRVVNVLGCTADWMLRQECEFGFVARLGLLLEKAFDQSILKTVKADDCHPTAWPK